jgi:hypothetical protein
MKFALDVAYCDDDMVVLRTVTLARFRVDRPVWRARCAIEAEAGAFERWSLRVGDQLEVRGRGGEGRYPRSPSMPDPHGADEAGPATSGGELAGRSVPGAGGAGAGGAGAGGAGAGGAGEGGALGGAEVEGRGGGGVGS